MRILVVEDNRDLNQIISEALITQGYSVDSCFQGEEALLYATSVDYDAIILDIMLPKLDGFGVQNKFRASGGTTPIIFLTARDSIADRVRGLSEGGDDYLVKPFSMEELLARIKVLIRRKNNSISNIYTIANLTLDTDTHIVQRDNTPIELTSKEFSILEYLIQNQGIVLSRERILEHVWDFDYFGGSNIVDVYINYLRKKIDTDYYPKLIHTVRSAGYVLREKA